MRTLFGMLAAMTLSTGAFATDLPATESYIGSISVQPCSSWTYDSSIRGYKCNFMQRFVDVPEHRDVQRLANLVDQLERKISDLERRIEQLEGQ